MREAPQDLPSSVRYSDEAFWVMVFYFDSKIWQEGGAITEGVQHNPDETL